MHHLFVGLRGSHETDDLEIMIKKEARALHMRGPERDHEFEDEGTEEVPAAPERLLGLIVVAVPVLNTV